jgi:CubicO group peptidase (beta-lactamase class C family)
LPAPEALAAALERLVRKEQADKRLPSVAAAVVRDGELLWESAVGTADVEAGRTATPDTQYRVGSITKTFTAAAVMQLRDAGKLDLDDPLDRHVDGAAHAPTLRALLSHLSGLQRETPDDGWLTQEFWNAEQLAGGLGEAEQVLPRGARWHYSNLAFAALGLVVERASGLPYERYVRERLLEPLGLGRTSFEPEEPAARGYLVQPYAEGVWTEAPVSTGAWIAAGQLWGTVADLCRWAAFLAAPDPDVLAPATVEEMRTVHAISDHERWTEGYGLGLMLRRDGEKILAGHGGAMPGFIAGLYVSPEDRVGAAVLTNSGTAAVADLTVSLLRRAVEELPVAPAPWQAGDPPPEEALELLGPWWVEGTEVVLRWRKGRLEGRAPEAADWRPPSVFRREAEDLWRTVSGPEQGERLRVERDADGRIVHLVWAGYPVTREPRPFAG